jgi:hypothetical protein
LGEQMVAPKSIKPWVYRGIEFFKSPTGNKASACTHSKRSFRADAKSCANPKKRVSTRRTFASRIGTRSEKQNAAMAPAVDLPIPGSDASASAV